jgi:hypothetical protein
MMKHSTDNVPGAVRRHPLLSGALAALIVAGAVVAAGAFSVPATAVTVDGTSISRATVDADLATIAQNEGFGCYLDASIAVRSESSASLPSIGGSGVSGTYDTSFVDFWLGQLVNNLLIETLAVRQHLPINATALAAGRDDFVDSITSTLEDAAAATGQSAVCAASGQAIVSTLPSGFVAGLERSQAAGDLVLAHAAGYGLGTAQLLRYFNAHQTQFRTICLSAIETATEATATTVRASIEAGQSFAAAAMANSTDATSAGQGGALGCYSANENAYPTVSADVKGLAVGTVSQPVSNNGAYVLLEVTSYQPAAYDAVVAAVRGAVLDAGATKAAKELSALTKSASVDLDPRYGKWSGVSGIGIEPPQSPAAANLLNPTA